jgi:hypothetical protein
MKLRSFQWIAMASALGASALLPGCGKRKAEEVNPIVPQFSVNLPRAPLGSAIEVTYTWTCEAGMKKLEDHRAFVHFVDNQGSTLFTDDHLPVPPTSAWEPGKPPYSYTRTVFVPLYNYVGAVDVRVGLYPANGKGPRVNLKGQDAGLHEFVAGKMELLPQTEKMYLVFKEGWHDPEPSPSNPTLEMIWTKKEAIVSFKNPKKDIVVYLEGDTNYKAFSVPPELTVSTENAGIVIPIPDSELFLKKLRFKADQLGSGEWVDLRLTMNGSFEPKAKGINEDVRELGLRVSHLYVAEADVTGVLAADTVIEAAPLAKTAPAKAPAGKTATGKLVAKPAAKPAVK